MDATTRKIQEAMTTFIEQRLSDKLDKEKNEDKRSALQQAHHPATWIADAASRVSQIQLVTHALKYSHPDARGSSLCATGCDAAGDGLVGTHTIRGKETFDVVGNAAALDVYKFLSIEVEGIPLWQRAYEKDSALLGALPGNSQENQAWVEAFSTLTAADDVPASHKLAKQVYWPIEDADYHLLQPLFPSALVHRANAILREVRSEETIEARKAQREQKPHSHGYRDWPNRVTQKYGGTKPQNISQLNSERRGEVWLLPSTPPRWREIDVRPPLKVESFFNRRTLPEALYPKARELGTYLAAVKGRDNIDIRLERARRVSEIIDVLIQRASSIHLASAGWSADADCDLPDTERYWLDPRRDDEAFQQQRSSTDWPRDIAERFGNWLNARLRHHKLPVGDAEYREWRREFEKELQSVIREMANV